MSKAKKYLVALTVSVALLGGFGLFTSPLFAKDANPETNTLTWNVSGKGASTYINDINAIVYDFQEYNGKMYVGGKFLNIVDPEGNTLSSATGDAPAFLAAFDIKTGAWDKTFFPKIDGPVYALDMRADGKLIAGGEFNGGVVALDPTTGAQEENFHPQIRRAQTRKPAVFDVEVVDNYIYVGGAFTKSANLPLGNLARLDATTGAVDPTWTPKTMLDSAPKGGKLVYGLDIDSDRGRVYAVGKFGGINNNTDAAYFATLDTQKGELIQGVNQGLPSGVVSHREIQTMAQIDVQSDNDKVYIGGQGHQTIILDAATLEPKKVYVTNRGLGDSKNNRGGDTQAIFVGDDVVASACHCWGGVDEYKLGSFNNEDGTQSKDQYYKHINDFAATPHQNVQGIYLINKHTNELLPNQFDISGSAGGWAITIDSSGSLWSGGQFNSTRKNHPQSTGLVRFGSSLATTPEVVETETVEATTTETTAESKTTVIQIGGDNPAIPPATTTLNTTPEQTTIEPAVETPKSEPQTTVTSTTVTELDSGVTPTNSQEPSDPTHTCAAPVPKQFATDTDGSAQIYRLYCAYFSRYPDAQGFATWQERHKNGYSMQRISAHFEASNENKPNRVTMSNADFVASLYKNILMREDTSSAGYMKWVEALDDGMARSELVLKFSNSKEFRVITGTD